ncbi:MAG: magnesium transporter MgtC [Dictyoglomus sp. NZ13-RE01]|nr:MAG: magnesium transporter MgtC [Dictyoglomus sp. NZ13-RE01]
MINDLEIVLRLLLSVVLGGIIGWEREKEEKPAGLRTHMLVCLGSTLIMIVSAYGFPGRYPSDPGRIAAQVITGIGFIGAGTILRTGATIKGLTTAASIWTVAGIGLAVGVGLYFPAILTTLLVVATLILAVKLEVSLIGSHKPLSLRCVIEDRPGSIGAIGSLLGSMNVDIKQIEISSEWDGKVILTLNLKLPAKLSEEEVIARLVELDNVISAEWT